MLCGTLTQREPDSALRLQSNVVSSDIGDTPKLGARRRRALFQ
jgi:hypothetical protein